ncbi:MAG: hypothetical protein A3G33_07920 [Omnitrophica bacterium RIFCSPLOWO2_12_FULL_44_17]|uniref:Uncharacterized protein n=1 Tax=Candidatus Danuiimicrobium aquiferis TaxID=1801832 RepID=A0A1G1L3T2_9BACT|nr:MAG: hypothetical protein A3G33_07920 [Omnitrophica bacterium RIFCSPLOWO2_12_FULL_44_17]
MNGTDLRKIQRFFWIPAFAGMTRKVTEYLLPNKVTLYVIPAKAGIQQIPKTEQVDPCCTSGFPLSRE